jgi:hypothetical protein
MLQSSGLANTPCWACLFERPTPQHPNGPPGTDFWEAETKGLKTLTDYDVPVSETGRFRTTPPIRRISHAARNSPIAHDCVVVDAAWIEPVSTPNSLLYLDSTKTREAVG